MLFLIMKQFEKILHKKKLN